MEPQLPAPHFSPESHPQHQANGGEFRAPVRPEQSPAPVEQGSETRETFSDGPKGDPVSAPATTPPPLPVIGQTPAQTSQTTTHDDTNPSTAADDDLIEKEWVEKAKKVVAETRHDPYAQDQAVSRLQADYLKKRYDKDVKLSTDG